MNIEKFKPAIVYTIYIASTPEKVWQALTTAEFSRQYFSGFAIEADLKVGGAFMAARARRLGAYQRRGDRMRSAEEADRHLERQLAGAGGKARADARHLRDRAGGRCREADDAAVARPCDQRRHPVRRPSGWPAILSSLKSVLETGQALAIKMAPPERMLAALKEMGIGTP